MELQHILFVVIICNILFIVPAKLVSERPPDSPTSLDNPIAIRSSTEDSSGPSPNVLVLNAAAGWEHDSIPAATKHMQLQAERRGWSITVSSDASQHFNSPLSLHQFDVIVFLLTTGPILSDVQKVAFKTYVEEGGAVVGVHSAVDTNRDWPFFVKLLGAQFAGHPHVQWARLNTLDQLNPSTKFLRKSWKLKDEFYNFVTPLRLDDKHILLTVDETSYEGGQHSAMHPISWTKKHLPANSRIWVTVLGHPADLYTNHEWSAKQFQRHLAFGIEWAANGTATARRRAQEAMKDLA